MNSLKASRNHSQPSSIPPLLNVSEYSKTFLPYDTVNPTRTKNMIDPGRSKQPFNKMPPRNRSIQRGLPQENVDLISLAFLPSIMDRRRTKIWWYEHEHINTHKPKELNEYIYIIQKFSLNPRPIQDHGVNKKSGLSLSSSHISLSPFYRPTS